MYNINNRYYGYTPLNESKSLIDGNTEWILSLGSIKFLDKSGKMVEVPCREFVKIVDMALGRIESRFPYISPYIMHSKVMYVPYAGGVHSTMAVDTQKNLWINMPFVYNELNMNVDTVLAILFHELMHNVLGHIEKVKEKFPIVKRVAMGGMAWEMESIKINICTDMEVNCDMVADGIVSDSFWGKMGGVYDKDYTGKMWEQIYSYGGDELFKKFYGKRDIGDKTLDVLKAFEEYADEISKPGVTEREKEKAREELEKKLEDILGKDPSKKGKKGRTIKSALEKIKNMLREFDDIVEILNELIDIYTITPERFDNTDFDNAISAINKFEGILNKNIGAICSGSTHLSESSFREYISECMDTFRTNTKTVFDGKSTLSKEEIYVLNRDSADAIWSLLDDEDAKDKSKDDRKKRKEELEKKKEREMMKEKIDKKKRHLLFGLFRKLANISNLIDIERVSEETHVISKDMAEKIRDLLEIPLEEIKAKDIEGIIAKCSDLGNSLSDDLIYLYDNDIITKYSSSELKSAANDAADKIKNALEMSVNPSVGMAEKNSAMVDALDSLNEVGKLLRTTKKTKPSDEFKRVYKEETKRLTGILKKFGADVLKEHLTDMGYGPESSGKHMTGDVAGTDIDPEVKK